MKDYEIALKCLNGCAGSTYPQTCFDKAALSCPEAYLRAKHGRDAERFTGEILSPTHSVYTFQNGVTYIYRFTEL